MFEWLQRGDKAPEPRKGMPRLKEAEFKRRYREQFNDPNAARTLLSAVMAQRDGDLVAAGQSLQDPRQK
ncbi:MULTISPECIES: hypothetical protein [Mesorhizobium]|uniref:hypothetical protein n=1 Tax=Mesorhizobium TaxID=68287 RepID=UPI0010A95D03|nr:MULTISPECIES: hypothetical protein [Mesorhizobium]